MASGEAEPLQYTTTVLRVSIHCEGCKKKVKKVLQNIEGVYKVTIDAAQHKVTVTSSVGADVLVRRLHKSGKHATVWPSPPVAAAAKQKPDEVAAAPPPAAAPAPAGERGKGAEKKAKEAAKEAGTESSEKKPEKEKKAEAKKPAKDDAAKKEGEVPEKEKGSPEPNKESAAAAADEEEGGEESGGKKGKKKKNKQKDGGGEADAAAPEKPAAKAPPAAPAPSMPAPAPTLSSPERPHGGFPYYSPQPVMSYNVAHPSASVSSYYAPTPVMSMQPTPMPPPPQMSYGYSPYPPMMMPPPPPPEYLYGPPGMRSSLPQESYSNMFNEENPSSCSVM
ncbi:hypothetical protein OsI_27287 [Oryza sativa Indica Group]|uniref:HMA domain-containing protein n=1 Tax=Oryza sativa subsp. indica TaxID=39946 RepID=A2YPT5_ORYSI|nr:hypothetical protein OsI_27287 [Oryza sativa Indica Group]